MFGFRILTATLPLLCVFLLTLAGRINGHENGPRVKVTAEVGGDAVLPCSLSTIENIAAKLFDWKKDGQKEVFLYDAGIHYNNGRSGQDEQFKGRVSHFQEGLKQGNASIKISNTKVADSGNYTCAFPRLQPSLIFHVELVVGGILKDRSKENIPGAAREPSVTTLDQTKDWSLLLCEVTGASPKPTVEWKDSAGNIVPAEEPKVTERGGSYDITLQATVSRTDRYRCVVTQEEIKHQIYAESYVHINGAATEPYVTILDQTQDGMLLQCVVRGASPKPKVEWKDSSGNIVPAEEPKVTERGGSYDITLQATVSKTDTFRCVVTQEEINHQTDAEIYAQINESSTGWMVAAVFSFVLFAVGVFIVVVLIFKGVIKVNCKKETPSKRLQRHRSGNRPDPEERPALHVL